MNLKIFLLVGSLAMTGCHGGEKDTRTVMRIGQVLSIGLPFALATYQFSAEVMRRHKQVRGAKEPSQKVVKWAQPLIEGCGVNNVKMLVGKDDSCPMEAIAPNIICLSPKIAKFLDEQCEAEELCEAFPKQKEVEDKEEAEDKERDERSRNFWAEGIPHEIGHLHYGDVSHGTTASYVFGFPLAVQLASSGLGMLLKASVVPSTIGAQAIFLGACLAAGSSKALVGSVLRGLYVRNREARADEFACQHITSPEILRGAADYYRDEVLWRYVERFQNGEPLPGDFGRWTYAEKTRYLRIACFAVDPAHPDPSDRADALDRARERLLQQEAGRLQ